ncbi:hypothetical protein M404DRAFT_618149 [Pisolithus tinctorius Marx 270]|uniref:Uncharacterized protein n=1 Tax=Pisolithus tinctorius Marx 270 TaxID=870435 RepID=A0A0C3K1G4_PISTI|nr:hypothetical protein M404DRAFT_618149 [Pisolithus tinctorius Marx 270]
MMSTLSMLAARWLEDAVQLHSLYRAASARAVVATQSRLWPADSIRSFVSKATPEQPNTDTTKLSATFSFTSRQSDTDPPEPQLLIVFTSAS